MAESEPLWKACADWLCRLEVLPENHRILLPDANIEDLGKFWVKDSLWTGAPNTNGHQRHVPDQKSGKRNLNFE